MMNRDQLSMVPARDTIQTAYAALSGAQSAPPAQQVMAYAVLFYEACQVLRLDPSQMLDAAQRLHRHAQDHYSVELRALNEYIAKELNK
jgi:hypothetical protein